MALDLKKYLKGGSQKKKGTSAQDFVRRTLKVDTAVQEKPKEDPKQIVPGFKSKIIPPAGQTIENGRKLANGRLAFTTGSGTIWEYDPDGRRIVKLAAQFGGGGWEDTGPGSGLIGTAEERQEKRDYAGVPETPGHQRDHIIPVSLGGISDSRTNIRPVLTRDNPASLEALIANRLKAGEISLPQARMEIMLHKQKEFLSGEPKLNWLEKTAENIAGGLKQGAKDAVSDVKDLANKSAFILKKGLDITRKVNNAEVGGYKLEDVTNPMYMGNPVMARNMRKQEEQVTQMILDNTVNTPQGKKVVAEIATNTEDLPLKGLARLQSIGDRTYAEAIAEWRKKKEDPNNNFAERVFYSAQSSIPQTAIGVILSVGSEYLTRGKTKGVLGRTIASTYFGAISANEQIKEKGKVDDVGNIAIDVVGDQLLGESLTSLFKTSAKTWVKDIIQGFGVEGGTEVSQTLLKFSNDYRNAETDEERNKVVEKAKNYVKDGDIFEEFLVGGISGGGIAAVGVPTSDTQSNVDTTEEQQPQQEVIIENGRLKVVQPEVDITPTETKKKPVQAKVQPSTDSTEQASRTIFRGVSGDEKTFIPSDKGAYKDKGWFAVTSDRKTAKGYGDKVLTGSLPTTAKVKTLEDYADIRNNGEIEQAQKDGFDAVEFTNRDDENEIIVFNPAIVQEKVPEAKIEGSKDVPIKTDKVSKIAESINQKAIEQKLTQGFEDLAEFDSINIKDQAQQATALVNEDIERTRRIIKGEEALPGNLRGTALVTAVEEYVKATGDVNVAFELANSPLVSGTSLAAQELRLAAERTPDSATAKLLEVKKARETQSGKDVDKKKSTAKKSLKDELKKTHLSKEDLVWDKFLDEITC